MRIPEGKISETLLEFGDPLLSQLEDPTVEEFRVALTIVIVVWNVHGLSKTTGESRSAYLQKLARVRQRLFDERAPGSHVITALDTNVLVDILEPDPRHGAASAGALARCLAEGTVIACDVAWAEVATVYGEKQAELLAALETLGIDYSEVTQEAALEAARHWHAYRSRGGTRQRIAADFIVGGHARAQGQHPPGCFKEAR